MSFVFIIDIPMIYLRNPQRHVKILAIVYQQNKEE